MKTRVEMFAKDLHGGTITHRGCSDARLTAMSDPRRGLSVEITGSDHALLRDLFNAHRFTLTIEHDSVDEKRHRVAKALSDVIDPATLDKVAKVLGV